MEKHHKKLTHEEVQKEGESPEHEEEMVRSLESEEESTMNTRLVLLVFSILIVLGIFTGYMLSRGAKVGRAAVETAPGEVAVNEAGKKVSGSTDTQTFKDSAVGMLEAGGLDAEGTHKLIRDGGPSQTVYLLSSVVDLDLFVGKKVKVLGETQAAKKAAWLMDVGRIEEE